MTDAPPDDDALLDKVAKFVVDRHLTAPAIFFLESGKPLSFVGSQAMHVFTPFYGAFFPGEVSYTRFATLLETRENVERLIRKIESRAAEPPRGDS